MLKFFTHHLSPNRLRQAREIVFAEQAVLFGVGLAAALIFAFIEIADEVNESETHEIDIAILEMFRAPGDPSQMIGPFWLQEAVRDVTALGSFSVLTLMVSSVVIYLLLTRRAGAAILVSGAVISGSLLTDLLKTFFDRPRPEFSALELTPVFDGTLDLCQECGALALAWSPLGGGRLMTGQADTPDSQSRLDDVIISWDV